jgi:hypothetical protein
MRARYPVRAGLSSGLPWRNARTLLLELACARAVHETIGKLLSRSDGQEAERGANVIASDTSGSLSTGT